LDLELFLEGVLRPAAGERLQKLRQEGQQRRALALMLTRLEHDVSGHYTSEIIH
jgi:hypothetical protein